MLKDLKKNKPSIFDKFKDENEVLKYKECSSTLGSLYNKDFYACSSGEDSYYLCEYCALVCHKEHKDPKISKRNFICSCAKNGHKCKKAELIGNEECFYQKFFHYTPNNGFFYGRDKKTYCSVCYNYCGFIKRDAADFAKENKGQQQKYIAKSVTEKKDMICCCTNHCNTNAVLLQGDLYSHKNFVKELKNFNSNIFFKNETIKDKLICKLIENIEKIKDEEEMKFQEDENLKNFLKDANNVAILTLFYVAFFNWKNKFFYLEEKLFAKIRSKIFAILRYRTDANKGKDGDEDEYEQCKLQLYLANLMFSMNIRKEYIANNNLWNIKTILNMNIKQRKKYFLDKKSKRKTKESTKRIIEAILSIYQKLLTDFYSDAIRIEQIYAELFPLLNKLMKFAIKYCIAENDAVKKYFELVAETIKFLNESKKNINKEDENPALQKRKYSTLDSAILYGSSDFKLLSLAQDTLAINKEKINLFDLNFKKKEKGSNANQEKEKGKSKEKEDDTYSFAKISNTLILKSILYYLLYSNDKMVRKAIKGNTEYKFIFNTKDDTLDKIKYIFFHIINEPQPTDAIKINLYNFIISNIFSLMCEKNQNFYYYSLKNLTLLPNDKPIHYQHRIFIEFSNSIRTAARNYFTYNLQLEDFASKTAQEQLRTLQSKLSKMIELPQINIEYGTFLTSQLVDPIVLRSLQAHLKDTQFFEAMEEIIHICGMGQQYMLKYKSPEDISPSIELRQFMLQLYYLILQNDPEMVCLLMNIKTKVFIYFFSIIEDDLFNFFNRLIEITFSTNYYYNNITFIMDSLLQMKDYINTECKDKKKILKLSTFLMKILSIIVNKYHNNHQIDIFDYFLNILQYFTKDKNNNGPLIIEYLKNFTVTEISIENEFIDFFANYLDFLASLYSTEMSRYCEQLITKDDLIPFELVEGAITRIIECKDIEELKIDVRIIYPLLKYYIVKSLPLKTNIIFFYDYTMNMLSDLDPNAKSFYNNRFIGLITQLLRKESENRSVTSKKEIEDIISDQKDKIFKLLDIIDHFYSRFEEILYLYVREIFKFESFISLKVQLYKFFEDIFVKPAYYLFKNLELYIEYIPGKSFEQLMKFIFNFIKVTQLFYMNINDLEKFDDRELSLYQSLTDDFYSYEKIHIKRELTNECINSMKNSLIEIKGLKFYKVKEIFTVYNNHLLSIFEFDENANKNINSEKVKVNDDKNLEKIIEIYHSKLQGKSEFINLQKDFFDLSLLNSDYFKLATPSYGKDQNSKENEKMRASNAKYNDNDEQINNKYRPSNLKIRNLSCIQHFISIMECISDFNYISKNDDNNSIITNLKKVADEDICDFYLMLITFSNVNEVIKTFELHTKQELQSASLHCYLNSILTKFFQILCEGNQIEMKDYLFGYTITRNDPATKEKQEYYNLINKDKLKNSINEKKAKKGKSNNASRKESEISHSRGPSMKRLATREINEAELMQQRLFSFFNIISSNMRVLALPVQQSQNCPLTSEIVNVSQKNCLYNGVNHLFGGYKYLLVEIIQGIKFKNDNIFSIGDPKSRASSAFYWLCCDLGKLFGVETKNVRETILPLKDIFDPLTEEIKIHFLEIIDNILKQKFEKSDFSFVFKFLPDRNNYFYIQQYIKYIYIKYIDKVDTSNPEFENKFKTFECGEEQLKKLIRIYKKDPTIYQDNYLKMACLIHYILKSLNDKGKMTEAMDYFRFAEMKFSKEIMPTTRKKADKKEEEVISLKQIEKKEDNKPISMGTRKSARKTKSMEKRKSTEYDQDQSLQDIESEKKKNTEEENKQQRINYARQMMSQKRLNIMASKFLGKILKSVEIVRLEDENSQSSGTYKKSVYFQLTPETYMINKKVVDNFLSTADRSTNSSKLKSIFEKLPDYLHEIHYKKEFMKKRKYDWAYNFNYLKVDQFNCIFCFGMNIIYLLTLDKVGSSVYYLNIISSFLEMILICINLFFIVLFIVTRYPLNISLLKAKYESKKEKKNLVDYYKLTVDYLKIYFIDSLLLSDEINLMILVALIGITGYISKYDIIFFGFQLLTIGKFVSTIREIIYAFVKRTDQLVSMILFLAIIMFAFANYDYYFLRSEYMLTQDDGSVMDTCSSLLECFITLFNTGARSGGGIGDLLPERQFNSAIYFHRWIHDMIFFIIVILLLLNMINGVIVTTFGQIREDSTNREKDESTVCFICSIKKCDIEQKGQSFENHVKEDHSVKTYIRYLVSLYLMELNNMDQDQYEVYNCVQKNDVKFFPQVN